MQVRVVVVVVRVVVDVVRVVVVVLVIVFGGVLSVCISLNS